MNYMFTCRGNSKILATHPRSIKLTKRSNIGLDETSIIGCESTFDFEQVSKFLDCKNIEIVLVSGDLEDSFRCRVNPYFIDKHQILFRKSGFEGDKTLGLYADKGSSEINRQLINKMKLDGTKLQVLIRKLND